MLRGTTMQDMADHGVSDGELMALLRTSQQEKEAHGELNELNLLLHDFARELLKRRLLLRIEFLQMMELRRPTQRTPCSQEASSGYATKDAPL
jgi:hypothetical protein